MNDMDNTFKSYKYRNIFYTDQLHCYYKYIIARLMKEGKGSQCQFNYFFVVN